MMVSSSRGKHDIPLHHQQPTCYQAAASNIQAKNHSNILPLQINATWAFGACDVLICCMHLPHVCMHSPLVAHNIAFVACKCGNGCSSTNTAESVLPYPCSRLEAVFNAGQYRDFELRVNGWMRSW
jgi:hypothetical protein